MAAVSETSVVIVGPKIGTQIHLEQPVVIGRDPACAVHFDSDMISRRHARVESVAGIYQVQDLGSTNGTYVNDRRVEPAELAGAIGVSGVAAGLGVSAGSSGTVTLGVAVQKDEVPEDAAE